MAIEVRPATSSERKKWNTYVERSDQGTIFHRLEWLETVEDHSNGTLQTYVGVKGESVCGLFPFYNLRKGPFSVVMSPLPGTGVPFLGPALLLDPNVKQRKRDKSNKRFVDGWFERVREDFAPSYISVSAAPGYSDVRPFSWQDFTTDTSYTYRVDLSGNEEAALKRFSGDARSSITNPDPDSYTTKEGDAETVELVYDHITRRYEEQSRSYPLDEEYLLDVYSNLGDGFIRSYEGWVDGDCVSGRLSLFSDRSAYLWQGSPKPDADIDVPINDLLNWRTMQDAIKEGVPECDQVGANNYRISRYKSKFNPELVHYHKITKGSLSAKAALGAYKKYMDR